MSDEFKLVSNLTPKRLKIQGNNHKLLELAPLEKNRRLTQSELAHFDQQNLKLQNLIEVEDEEKKDAGSRFAEALPSVGVVLFFVFGIGHAFTKESPVANRWFWIGGISVTVIVIVAICLVLWKGSLVARRLVAQFFSLLLILAFGIALPGLVIYHFNGGRELIANNSSLVFLGRCLQFVFIITASLLPALLYFLFDRQQLGTLRDRFEQQIFRLDPNVKNLGEVTAKYGRQLSEIYGAQSATGEGRLIRATRWPIFMATLVITLGWLLTLLPTDRTLVINQANELSNLFLPRPTGVTFAFLGAYFFALNTSLLRYTRADLKPKAYSSITVRILLVIILAWVFGSFLPKGQPVELVLLFAIGIFPESGLTLIKEYLRKQSFSMKNVAFGRERSPLTNLQDIDIYDRARLADEGVTNIEGLAHHDLVDLMLETRIAVPRLVDWVDQAVLYLHLVDGDELDDEDVESNKEAESKKETDERKSEVVKSTALGQCLRKYGIRTATDFITAWKETEHLQKTLNETDKDSFRRLQVVFDVMQDDEWLNYLTHWREHSIVETEMVTATFQEEKKEEPSGDAVERVGVPVVSLASQGSLEPNGGKE